MELSQTDCYVERLAKHSHLFDPDLPTASSVMASLNCVAVQFVMSPSIALAELAASLAYTLTAPEYAESPLIEAVAKNLVQQWDSVLYQYQMQSSTSAVMQTRLQ